MDPLRQIWRNRDFASAQDLEDSRLATCDGCCCGATEVNISARRQSSRKVQALVDRGDCGRFEGFWSFDVQVRVRLMVDDGSEEVEEVRCGGCGEGEVVVLVG